MERIKKNVDRDNSIISQNNVSFLKINYLDSNLK